MWRAELAELAATEGSGSWASGSGSEGGVKRKQVAGDKTDGKINCCWFFPRRRRDSVLVEDFEYVKGVVAATPAFLCRATTA